MKNLVLVLFFSFLFVLVGGILFFVNRLFNFPLEIKEVKQEKLENPIDYRDLKQYEEYDGKG